MPLEAFEDAWVASDLLLGCALSGVSSVQEIAPAFSGSFVSPQVQGLIEEASKHCKYRTERNAGTAQYLCQQACEPAQGVNDGDECVVNGEQTDELICNDEFEEGSEISCETDCFELDVEKFTGATDPANGADEAQSICSSVLNAPSEDLHLLRGYCSVSGGEFDGNVCTGFEGTGTDDCQFDFSGGQASFTWERLCSSLQLQEIESGNKILTSLNSRGRSFCQVGGRYTGNKGSGNYQDNIFTGIPSPSTDSGSGALNPDAEALCASVNGLASTTNPQLVWFCQTDGGVDTFAGAFTGEVCDGTADTGCDNEAFTTFSALCSQSGVAGGLIVDNPALAGLNEQGDPFCKLSPAGDQAALCSRLEGSSVGNNPGLEGYCVVDKDANPQVYTGVLCPGEVTGTGCEFNFYDSGEFDKPCEGQENTEFPGVKKTLVAVNPALAARKEDGAPYCQFDYGCAFLPPVEGGESEATEVCLTGHPNPQVDANQFPGLTFLDECNQECSKVTTVGQQCYVDFQTGTARAACPVELFDLLGDCYEATDCEAETDHECVEVDSIPLYAARRFACPIQDRFELVNPFTES